MLTRLVVDIENLLVFLRNEAIYHHSFNEQTINSTIAKSYFTDDSSSDNLLANLSDIRKRYSELKSLIENSFEEQTIGASKSSTRSDNSLAFYQESPNASPKRKNFTLNDLSMEKTNYSLESNQQTDILYNISRLFHDLSSNKAETSKIEKTYVSTNGSDFLQDIPELFRSFENQTMEEVDKNASEIMYQNGSKKRKTISNNSVRCSPKKNSNVHCIDFVKCPSCYRKYSKRTLKRHMRDIHKKANNF